MEPRRRIVDLGGDLPTLNPGSAAAERMRVEELQLDPQILKIWEEFEKEDIPPLDEDYERRRKPVLTNQMVWFLLMTIVGIMLVIVNHMSTKEMHRLKTETRPNAPQSPHEGHWWYTSLVYHIFPRSFKDSNDDGIGDIQGIISQLGHLSYLRADAILLSSVVKSANVDVGRDPTDYYDIDPALGTMEDFEQLLEELHDRDIRLILELIPNHTSDLHPWFESSRQGADSPFADWFVWHEGHVLENGTRVPPSNWLSRYGGPAWTWDTTRGAYYYHQYSKHTPDLNHHYQSTRAEILKVLDYWVKKGVDGVLIDDMHAIFEAELVTLDEPINEAVENNAKPGTYEYLEHVYTDDQPEMHEYLAYWREHIDVKTLHSKRKVFLGCRAVDDMNADILKYYSSGVDAPLCPALTHVTKSCDATCVHQLIDDWLIELPDGKTTFWQLSSSDPDIGRVATRRGRQYAGALAVVQLLLPGSSLIYYGDEIGMEDAALSLDEVVDVRIKTLPQGLNGTSDPGRTPMQWTGGAHAGFTQHSSTWLPLHRDYKTINVQVESEAPVETSMLKLYRELVMLRQTPPFQQGFFKFSLTNQQIISYIRFKQDENPHLIITNLGAEPWTGDLSFSAGVDTGTVVIYHCPPGLTPQPALHEGTQVALDTLKVRPGEAFVILLF